MTAGRRSGPRSQICALTFARPGEIRGARRSEIMFEKSRWRIPASGQRCAGRMTYPLATGPRTYSAKCGRCPSSAISFSLLSFPIKGAFGKRIQFRPAPHGLHPGETTAHGFRATASTILNENKLQSRRHRSGARPSGTRMCPPRLQLRDLLAGAGRHDADVGGHARPIRQLAPGKR